MMSTVTKTYILPILLITLFCVAAVEGLYYFGEKYLQTQESAERDPSAAVSATDRDTVIKDFKKPIDSSVIIERNLFASRKGSDIKIEEEVSPTAVELSSMDVVLMGTVSGTGDGVRAIIYDKKDKKQELFQVGDYLQQAIIKQILRGKVILNLNGKDEMLDISEARNVNIPMVAKIHPVVQTRKVVGRPVGQQVNNKGSVPQNGLTPGINPGNRPIKQPRQLRSYRGGVIVRDKTVAPQ